MLRDTEDWERLIGARIKRLRLDMDMRQEELASRAQISVPTITRLENGKGSSLQTLIKVLQVLRQESWLEQLAPQPSVNPIAFHHKQQPRQRAGRRQPSRAGKARPTRHEEGTYPNAL
ncbi:MAG: helix-turn-helix domain-containing protein [Coriobacteriales bacterium]|jgi:transcriptional regulator with XRE-family HTH domain|nr:helix-turn-helix domain-containing protein [Coriobacteriales bacterium]